jgi:hypothetical protein
LQKRRDKAAAKADIVVLASAKPVFVKASWPKSGRFLSKRASTVFVAPSKINVTKPPRHPPANR